MGRARVVLGVLGAGAAALALTGAGGWFWATGVRDARLAATVKLHAPQDFPVPFPLSDAEVAELRAAKEAELSAAAPPIPAEGAAPIDALANVDLGAVALERAVSRGKHLVDARYVCSACHQQNFGGGAMLDDPLVGRLLAPNLTLGKGGVTANFAPADWDRIVRHGLLAGGHPTIMPAEDFDRMSDRELSDIIAYLRSVPPVDNVVGKSEFGPLLTVLMATGAVALSADTIPHGEPHAVEPPPETETLAFGAHLVQVCTGCHRAALDGGPIVGAPPDWAPAANLTPGALSSWTYEDFATALREMKRPDGTALRLPMTDIQPFAANMTETELRALWAYLQSLPPLAQGT